MLNRVDKCTRCICYPFFDTFTDLVTCICPMVAILWLVIAIMFIIDVATNDYNTVVTIIFCSMSFLFMMCCCLVRKLGNMEVPRDARNMTLHPLPQSTHSQPLSPRLSYPLPPV